LVVLLNRRVRSAQIDIWSAEPAAGRILLDSDPPAATQRKGKWFWWPAYAAGCRASD
jgi:hypothetical protein